MSELNPWGTASVTFAGQPASCEAWAAQLPEAMDGQLSGEALAQFERHGQACEACARMLEEARQGAAWLEYIDEDPAPPPELLQAILSNSRPLGEPADLLPQQMPALDPVWAPAVAARQWIEPRIMMTVAMTVFSIALTVNLVAGKVSAAHFGAMRLSEVQPAELSAVFSRPYFAAHARVARYYENLRLVHEVEAEWQDLRQSSQPFHMPSLNPGGGQMDRMDQMDQSAPPHGSARRAPSPVRHGQGAPAALPAAWNASRIGEWDVERNPEDRVERIAA